MTYSRGASSGQFALFGGGCLRIERMNRRSLTSKVRDHHFVQFGDVNLSQITTKLGEECGEVCGAVIRRIEERDGHDWHGEIVEEIGDVLIVLHSLAAAVGEDLDSINRAAVDAFLDRTWNTITPGRER